MNKMIVIPLAIGIIIMIIGISVISNQESEIEKNNEQNNLENKTSVDENIDNKLDQIDKKAEENFYEPAQREWITSGPFQIDRSKYVIGEKIFIRIGELDPNEKGQISLLRPSNETHYTVHQTIPFDGSAKNAFNYYLDVRLSKALAICSIDDIIGEWTIVFRGTDYPNIKFEFKDEILPGEEDAFEPVC